jgi:lipid-A-disaccharide synthase-like uncharacterized protein
MHAELEAATADGKPMAFAMGCLVAAARQLPAFPEGRLALASHALVLCIVVPVGALCLWVALMGYPYLAFGDVGLFGFLAGQSEQIPLLGEGAWGLAPALTLCVLLQAAGQFLLAWFVLERDWQRVATIGRFLAATLTTLLIVMTLLEVIDTIFVLQIAVLITEALAALSVAWRHDEMALRRNAAFAALR